MGVIDLERGTVSIKATLVLLAATIAAAWALYLFSDARDKAHAESLKSFRDELAEVGDAMARQAAQVTALREQSLTMIEAGREQTKAELSGLREFLTQQLAYIARDQERLSAELSAQRVEANQGLRDLEASTSAELRELRAGLREASATKKVPDEQ